MTKTMTVAGKGDSRPGVCWRSVGSKLIAWVSSSRSPAAMLTLALDQGALSLKQAPLQALDVTSGLFHPERRLLGIS